MKEDVSQLSIVFISTLLTPHQIPFCNEMKHLCTNFTFFQMNNVGEEWVSKGETIRRKDFSYLRNYTETSECQELILHADVVLIGGCDLALIKERLKTGKIVFVYLERFYKKGITIKNFVKCVVGTYIHHGRYQKYNVNLLCAGAYCAGDAAIFGNYIGRTFKWGYFPKFEEIKADDPVDSDQIIWVGRLIDWKHANDAVKAVAELVQDHPNVLLKIYGDGEEKDNIFSLIQQLHLENNVRLEGSVPAETVKQEMQHSAIFLSTSDYQEGWGAVLNEAMNCRCAVIASHAAGSTPFLIKNGINGYIYERENVRQIADLCRRLLDNTALRKRLSDNAYQTIRDSWNPKQAAQRFLTLAEALINGGKTPYEDGPCSVALPIRQGKMYSILLGENNA